MKNDSIIKPPVHVMAALNRLENAGYSAYLVGGCVRDTLLGGEPKDWDIATDARPEQVMACFEDCHVIPTGIKHGTVTVVLDGYPLEVTTFRVDGAYSDNRRPDSVSFTNNLTEDLSRRDFTVNAMAWSVKTGLFDPFGGEEHLEARFLVCVGEPERRFREDALRILRGARFASVLGFQIESKTRRAMLELTGLLENIAVERITIELNKAIMGKSFAETFLDLPEILTQIIPELAPGVYFDQRNPAHKYDVYGHTLRAVGAASYKLPVRLALLFHDIGKPSHFTIDDDGIGHFHGHPQTGMEAASRILERLRYENAIQNQILPLILWHDTQIDPESKAVKRWLRRLGAETFRLLLEVQTADNLAKSPDFGCIRLDRIKKVGNTLEQVLKEQACFQIGGLAIGGRELIEAGVPQGPKIGELLSHLLDLVIDEKIPNTKEALLAEAANRNIVN